MLLQINVKSVSPFNALNSFFYFFFIQLITRNLQLFINQLQSKQPLFQMETVLSAPEIGLSPPAGELRNMMMQAARETVERYIP